jgi:hypothetical protein
MAGPLSTPGTIDDILGRLWRADEEADVALLMDTWADSISTETDSATA